MRIKFHKGGQRKFLKLVLERTNCPSLLELSKRIEFNYSTLKNYYGESSFLSEEIFNDLCYLSAISKSSLGITFLEDNWGLVKGGKIGMRNMTLKYKKQLPLWRKKAADKIAGMNIKQIRYPKMSEELAEFIGAYLGDGTITNYFIRISGDSRYDVPYFNHLFDLVFRLFGVKAKITKDKRLNINTFYLTIYSKNICEFLRRNYGIKYGDKIRNKTCIPPEILTNKKFSIACFRGLVDTDGSVSRRGSGGKQFCINFTSHNPLLLSQVDEIGRKLGVFSYKTKDNVGTNKWENILNYFKIVGSSNLRHIVRFYLRYKYNKTIYQNECKSYYGKTFYKNISLPFKMVSWSSG